MRVPVSSASPSTSSVTALPPLSAHLRIPAEISMEIGGWSNDKTMNEIYTHIARSDIERYKNEMWNFYSSTPAAPPENA